MRDIVAPVVQRNVCWAHSEAILLAMLADQYAEIRHRVIDKIRECRSEADDDLRLYHIPNINFHATDYILIYLIDWSTPIVTERTLTWQR